MSLSSDGIYEQCTKCHVRKLYDEFNGLATCNTCRSKRRSRYGRENANRIPFAEISTNVPAQPPPGRRRGRPALQNTLISTQKDDTNGEAVRQPMPDRLSRVVSQRDSQLPPTMLPGDVPEGPETLEEHRLQDDEHNRLRLSDQNGHPPEELEENATPPQSHTFVVNYQGVVIHDIEQLQRQTRRQPRHGAQAFPNGEPDPTIIRVQPQNPVIHNAQRLSQQLNEQRYPAFLSYMREHNSFPEKHYLGAMNIQCRYCDALHFQSERTPGDPLSFHKCCANGKINLTRHPIPDYIQDLLTDNNSNTQHFRTNIVAYNNAMAFTSVNAQKDNRLNGQGGIQSYVIRGELYHMQGPLRTASNERASFAQTYIYDAEGATGQRFQANNGRLKEGILRLLHQTLEECGNPFINLYKCAHEQIMHPPEGEAFRVIITPQMRLIIEQGSDQRRTNLPTANEVAVVIPDEHGDPCFRDLVLAERNAEGVGHHWHHVHPSHPAYLPLAYPLFFPNGEPGWHWSLRRLQSAVPRLEEVQTLRGRAQRQVKRTHLTQQEWFRYHLFYRPGRPSAIRLGCRLQQRLLVDAFASIDQQRLEWIKRHQDTIRADLYNGVQDLLRRQDHEGPAALEHGAGTRIVLPSSFTGGDRWMSSLYQDSMAISRRFGKPALFVTFTANPNWQEIIENLPYGLKPNDDPVIVTRVFRLKQVELLKDLKSMFGRYLGSCWVVEYQKRGLPHCHILIFLNKQDLFTTQEKVDEIISAELPNVREDADPNTFEVRLFDTISKHMIHGPCGDLNPKSPCMKPDKTGRMRCSKGFPKEFSEDTIMSENGYPQYRRRPTPTDTPNQSPFRRATFRQAQGADPVRVDNRWVVPHSPFLSAKYDAHINVEVCSSIEAIRYMHKYVFKGDDRTTLELREKDNEVAQYLNGRYVGPHQAAFRIFEYEFHGQEPVVKRLALHLPNQQPVFFGEDPSTQEMEQALERSSSMLLDWLNYNRLREDGHRYLYHEFPEHYVYILEKPRHWKPRQRGFAIGRVQYCSPNSGERFYLRMLLMRIPGATSFDDLRTVDGTLHPSFHAACIALGLVEDDNEWISCFSEASHWATGTALRALFIGALQFNLSNANALWERFKTDICSDLEHQIRTRLNVPDDLLLEKYDYGLHLIQRDLELYGRSLTDFGLPLPANRWDDYDIPALIATELDYDQNTEHANHAETFEALNDEQKTAYDTITQAIANDPNHAHFFLQGAGGTGKTFLYRVLCHYYRSQGEIVLCVASSGIASLLLPGGTTAHSRFKIPVPCFHDSECMIPAQSPTANLLRRAKLCIWDEVPMQNKHAIAAVERVLHDIRSNEHLFGGLPVVFGGDWAQTLPIVRKGKRAEQVGASLQKATFWSQINILFLTRNMRLGQDDTNRSWADFIHSMSYNPALYGVIKFPDTVTNCFTSMNALEEHIFPSNSIGRPDLSTMDPQFYSSRAILSARNDDVNEFNTSILKKLTTQSQTFYSVDKVVTDGRDSENEAHELSPEFIATLNSASIPAAMIKLKLGAPIMLLRNLHPRQGLCNGTRMIVTRLHRHCLEARILGGKFDGHHHCLPRIMLNSNEEDFPWVICRKQFPVRLCFAITINKSQGQSLQRVGIDLRSQCFSHGQLYVALSRVTDVRRLAILFMQGKEQVADNIVYPEILLSQNENAEA